MARLKESEGKSARSCYLPTRYTPVGGTFICRDRKYVAVLRDEVILPCNACSGCAFASGTCNSLQKCSSFDRPDGKNVWFKEIEL